MTHDLREALKKLVYRIRQRSTNKLHNREFAMTLDDCVRELSALTASPGEQEPVAGPTCRCHDDVSRKYCLDKDRCTPIAEAQSSTSPPPAAGWNGGKNHD